MYAWRMHPSVVLYGHCEQLLMNQLYITALVLAAAMPQATQFPEPWDLGARCPHLLEGPFIPPLKNDCYIALEKIRNSPPGTCDKMSYQEDITTVGTCTVRTYSAKGKAQCLDTLEILEGIFRIIRDCSSRLYTEGSYTWTQPGTPVEGVYLIATQKVPNPAMSGRGAK